MERLGGLRIATKTNQTIKATPVHHYLESRRFEESRLNCSLEDTLMRRYSWPR